MKKSNVPKIRFPGFTDAWEQRKLGEIYQKIRNAFVGTATPYYVKDGHFYLESNNVKDGQINRNSEIFINDEFYEKQKDNWLHTNDIVMVQSGHVGHTAVIPENLDNTAAHALIIMANPSEEICSHFVNYQFQAPKAKIGIDNITTGNTIKHILASEMKKFDIQVPNYEEQRCISKFLLHLDNLITLHQRKLDLLKEEKKNLLLRMFPRNGAFYPELRFPEFSEPWEQHKLGQVTKRVIRKNKNLESTLPLTISAQYGLVDQVAFFNKQVASKDISGYFLLKNGEFAYNKSYSKGFPWGVVKRLDKYDKGVLSTLYIVFKPTKVDSDFLVSYYETNRWHREVAKRAAEGARNHGLLNITPADFFNTELMVPTDKDEQVKIGQFFIELEKIIILHQRKKEHLCLLKKALLQQMFI